MTYGIATHSERQKSACYPQHSRLKQDTRNTRHDRPLFPTPNREAALAIQTKYIEAPSGATCVTLPSPISVTVQQRQYIFAILLYVQADLYENLELEFS